MMKTGRMGSREDLESIWRAGVAACQPSRVLPPHLPEPPAGRTVALAVGKAAMPMAQLLEEHWTGPLVGAVVPPHGTAGLLRHLELMTAAHPVPDAASVAAAQRLLALAEAAGPGDLVLVLLSGGASSLACLPSDGVTVGDKQRLTRDLLRSGAPIGSINCVRRHLSRIKGGRLGRAAQPARLVTLAISDVVGDRPEDIGSGPTVADETTVADAKAIASGDFGWSESVKPEEAALWRADYRIIASSHDAMEAAAAEAARRGYRPILLGACTGEARETAAAHSALGRGMNERAALISGGELNVTVTGSGSGGRNHEYALALAIALDGAAGIAALAADTDGVDGNAAAAGAFVDLSTLERGCALDPRASLADNDSAAFFAALGDGFVTGPTGTNVSDLRIILIDP